MRAALKEMNSLELSVGLEAYRPHDPENFGVSIRLIVGPAGSDGEESFDLLVCTPDWLKDQVANTPGIWGRHMLIVPSYDYCSIQEKIRHRIGMCEGRDWTEVGSRLARFAAWECEDYRP